MTDLNFEKILSTGNFCRRNSVILSVASLLLRVVVVVVVVALLLLCVVVRVDVGVCAICVDMYGDICVVCVWGRPWVSASSAILSEVAPILLRPNIEEEDPQTELQIGFSAGSLDLLLALPPSACGS